MRLSLSGLERALACPPSTVLPQVGSVTPDATRGHALHDFVAEVATGVVPYAALQKLPEELHPAAAAIDFTHVPGGVTGYAAEVAFLYDVRADTARELGRGLGRKYPAHAGHEVPGTADLVGLTEDAVVVWDWKFGWGCVTKAAQNRQLAGYALAAARAYGRRRAFVGLLRQPEGASPWFDWAELDELDLDATAAELRGLLADAEREAGKLAAGEALRTTVGPHCRYCPALRVCPAQATLAVALANPSAWQQGLPLELTLETAALALERIRAARAVLDKVEESIDALARQTPIPLGDGEVYGPRPHPTERLDAVNGALVLAKAFDDATARAAVKQTPTLTKESLKAALAGWRERHPEDARKPAALQKAALEALRLGGAATTTYTHPVVRHRPKPEALPAAAAAPAPAPEEPARAAAPAAPRAPRTDLPGERTDLTCPDCGAGMYLHVMGGRVRVYFCDRRPLCDANHGAHEDGSPHGVPADRATREARSRAHQAFDLLWTRSHVTREGAYLWLAKALGLTEDQAHIGRFDISTCEHVVAIASAELARLEAAPPPPRMGDDGQLEAPF